MRQVIGFAGPARCGKGTAADHLVAKHDFRLVKFAGPLKDMLRALGFDESEIEGEKKELPSPKLTHGNFEALCSRGDIAFKAIGVSLEDFEEHDPIPLLNNRTLAFVAAAFVGTIAQVIARGEKDGGASPRLLMQMIGTDWGRDMICSDLWIRLWHLRAHSVPKEFGVVVDDVRFPNEAGAVRVFGGVVYRITADRPGVGIAGSHTSEKQTLSTDRDIDNSRDIGSFLSAVDDLAWNLKLERHKGDSFCGR